MGQYVLIITVVNRSHAEDVVAAARSAGAEGSTIINARGTGIHEKMSFFGVTIEPEKEIVLTMIRKDIADDVMAAIVKAAKLDAPGKGIAFMLDVEKVAGVAHMK
jgi:nitrogen regulatory protein PII